MVVVEWGEGEMISFLSEFRVTTCSSHRKRGQSQTLVEKIKYCEITTYPHYPTLYYCKQILEINRVVQSGTNRDCIQYTVC